MKTASIYTFFALVATLGNLGSQWLVMSLISLEFRIYLAIIIGTAVGLVVKYVLDKRYIFNHKSESVAQETKTVTLYTLMGVVTTMIFWGTELLFSWLFKQEFMLYVGGALGLAIGYFVKYELDKRFVFNSSSQGLDK